MRGGKVDFLNLRGAGLKDVAFVDCVVVELDLQEATVDGLTFEGCTLVEPTFGRGIVCRPRPLRGDAAVTAWPGGAAAERP